MSSSYEARTARQKRKARKQIALDHAAAKKKRNEANKSKDKVNLDDDSDGNYSDLQETESESEDTSKRAKRQPTSITLVSQITVKNIQTLVLRCEFIHNKDLYAPCNTFPHMMYPQQYADPARAIVIYCIVKLCVHDTVGDVEKSLNKSVVPKSCKLPQQMRNVINTCMNRGQRFAVSALKNTCSLAVQSATGGITAKVLGDKHTQDPSDLDTIGNNAYAQCSTAPWILGTQWT
jgi:hypothetical protein